MDSRGGSKIARDGFRNESDVANKFDNWKSDIEAQEWLKTMGYSLDEIEYVEAEVLHGVKTDVQVQVTIKLKKLIEAQNLQVKLVSNRRGFNQIDKRWINNYKDLWSIPEDIVKLLKYYTGEIKPYKKGTRDSRRMYFTEMTLDEQNKILSFFYINKLMIITDVMKGRGILVAEWVLVAQKISKDSRWILKPMNEVMNYYSEGSVCFSTKGVLKIGKITVQRKGRRCRKRYCKYVTI